MRRETKDRMKGLGEPQDYSGVLRIAEFLNHRYYICMMIIKFKDIFFSFRLC